MACWHAGMQPRHLRLQYFTDALPQLGPLQLGRWHRRRQHAVHQLVQHWAIRWIAALEVVCRLALTAEKAAACPTVWPVARSSRRARWPNPTLQALACPAMLPPSPSPLFRYHQPNAAVLPALRATKPRPAATIRRSLPRAKSWGKHGRPKASQPFWRGRCPHA